MQTRYLIMRPEESHESGEVDWPHDPGYDRIRKLVDPYLNGAYLEHVSVLADPAFSKGTRGTWKPLDMFVDERGVLKGLPLNDAATVIYRRASLLRDGGRADDLPHVAGPAILFSRRVWF